MLKRSIIPALLTGLLAVGCTTASAQDEPKPEHQGHGHDGERVNDAVSDAVRAQREREERERHREELRRRVIEVEEQLAGRRAALDVARENLAVGRAQLNAVRTELREQVARVNTEIVEMNAQLEAAERRGLGELHPQVAEMNEQLSRLRRERETLEARWAEQGPALKPAMEQLREHEELLDQARARYAEAVATLDRLEPERGRERLSPADRAELERLRALGYVNGTPDEPFRRGGRAAAVPDRLARLERAVDELRRLFELHGVPADRQARGFAEMERRQERAPGPRRDPDARWPERARRGAGNAPGQGGGAGGGRRGEWVPGRGGAGGGPGQPGQPGTAGHFRGEAPRTAPLPPDAEAARARAEEVRELLERSRAENHDLRVQVEMLKREMEHMRERMERTMRDREEAERRRVEKDRRNEEGEGEAR